MIDLGLKLALILLRVQLSPSSWVWVFYTTSPVFDPGPDPGAQNTNGVLDLTHLNV